MFSSPCLWPTGCPCLRGWRSPSLHGCAVCQLCHVHGSAVCQQPPARGSTFFARQRDMVSKYFPNNGFAIDRGSWGRPEKSATLSKESLWDHQHDRGERMSVRDKVGVSCHDRSTAASRESPSWLRTLSSLPSEHPRSARKAALTQYHGVQAPQPSRWS